MTKALLAVLVVIAALVWSGALRAESTSVSLSNDMAGSLTIAAATTPTKATLTFDIPDFPSHPTVMTCRLRVVPTPQPNPPRADQDVSVLWKDKQGKEGQVGQWSAYSQTTKPYAAELKPEACAPGSRVSFELQTESQHTSWEYHGGAASPAANRPRLIVTYNSPTHPRSGDSTGWNYAEPAGFFATPLWRGEMLANPVTYNGALYVVAACASPNNGRCLYRVAGAGNVRNWPLGFQVTAQSFAFVTAWGRLQIITENGIRSCDLTTLVALRSEDKLVCDATKDGEQITVQAKETPAMGPDGSLYFKNVKAEGRIVARNPKFQEIWRTRLKFTTVSPIALSANGRNAYMLADIPIQDTTAAKMIALLRVDTATGETVVHEIFHCGSNSVSCGENDKLKPDLKTLLQPAVASKVIKVQGGESTVDYVFVAGNTSDTGVLQLIMFEPCVPSSKPCPPPSMLWNQTGTVSTAPVLSVDGNALFVAQGQDGTLTGYDWYNATPQSTGAVSNPVGQALKSLSAASTLFVDGSKRVYPCPKSNHCEFTVDGALIGYSDNAIYDLSPKYVPSPKGATDVWPSSLKTGMIYSADRITAPATPGVNAGDRVILKGQRIGLPNKFRWPLGATLKAQSVGPASQ